MCVGFAWHGLLRAYPIVQKTPAPLTIYVEAQRNDEWPGEDYDGSSVRGGAKALQKVGKLDSYGWAYSVEEAVQWVGLCGPVVLGTDWLSGMMRPNKDGIITVNGSIVGGHAYLLIGYDDRKKLAHIQNSWGKGWGKNGRGWMSYEDLDRLIRTSGEACAPTERVEEGEA